MMKSVVCCVLDVKVGSFAQPMFFQSRGAAVRMFTDEVRRSDPDNLLNRHPEDFELHYITDFDPERGRFDDCERSELLVAGRSIVE